MDDWEKFSETSLPEKEDFYAHAKRVGKEFEIKKLGECHDLYVQSNTLLLADEEYVTLFIDMQKLIMHT